MTYNRLSNSSSIQYKTFSNFSSEPNIYFIIYESVWHSDCTQHAHWSHFESNEKNKNETINDDGVYNTDLIVSVGGIECCCHSRLGGKVMIVKIDRRSVTTEYTTTFDLNQGTRIKLESKTLTLDIKIIK